MRRAVERHAGWEEVRGDSGLAVDSASRRNRSVGLARGVDVGLAVGLARGLAVGLAVGLARGLAVGPDRLRTARARNSSIGGGDVIGRGGLVVPRLARLFIHPTPSRPSKARKQQTHKASDNGQGQELGSSSSPLLSLTYGRLERLVW